MPSLDGLEQLTYTVDQAARVLQVSQRHMYYLVKKGEIPTLAGVGRRTLIPKAALTRWVERATQLPVQPTTGPTDAHAGHTAPATGIPGRGEPGPERGGNAACTEDPQQNAEDPELHLRASA